METYIFFPNPYFHIDLLSCFQGHRSSPVGTINNNESVVRLKMTPFHISPPCKSNEDSVPNKLM